jgi:glutamate--cysteine ligase catalytic subunit
MGFLTEGETLSWKEAKKLADYIRQHGIQQFLVIYNATKARMGDCLKFGDEIEYMLLHMDEKTKTVRLSLRGAEILEELVKEEHEHQSGPLPNTLWRPEYARYMLEGTPGSPYGDCVTEFRRVQLNMQLRRNKVKELLREGEHLLSFPSFPLMGVGQFTQPPYPPNGPVARSLFTPDEIIFPHNRFSTLTANIRERRGSKVRILVPVFRDTETKPLPLPEGACDRSDPQAEDAQCTDGAEEPKCWDIYMDSMAFGMGMCCLQCTFQCEDIHEARRFYDQLSVVCPVMLALTAATPIFRGYLSDVDARWDVISASVDDRTPEERGLKPLRESRFVIPKSRYGSIDCYISGDEGFDPKFNDLELVYDHHIYDQLREAGIDHTLARHLAHLFIRDPLVIYKDKVQIDDTKHSDHFENIQSTNWQNVRFKPPPPRSEIGWRTEFRPMEVQLTDFENAAFVVFMVLLTRTIRSFHLNFYIPITKAEENMKRAQKRDAVNTQTFYFRKVITKVGECNSIPEKLKFTSEGDDPDAFVPMTANKIMNGDDEFPGLIPLVKQYLASINIDLETRILVDKYLKFVSKRASGELLTTASWVRKFVREHKDYKQDSVVTPEITWDLMKTCLAITEGSLIVPELLGDVTKDDLLLSPDLEIVSCCPTATKI